MTNRRQFFIVETDNRNDVKMFKWKMEPLTSLSGFTEKFWTFQRFTAWWRGTRGAGARENRGREGYGRREKKGREAGSLRWREAGKKFKKASFCYLLLLTSSQETNPRTFLNYHLTFSEAYRKVLYTRKFTALLPVKLETFPSRLYHRTWMR